MTEKPDNEKSKDVSDFSEEDVIRALEKEDFIDEGFDFITMEPTGQGEKQ